MDCVSLGLPSPVTDRSSWERDSGKRQMIYSFSLCFDYLLNKLIISNRIFYHDVSKPIREYEINDGNTVRLYVTALFVSRVVTASICIRAIFGILVSP
ncbi:putative transposase like protein, partial [Danaus plexippus plexippus]